MMAPQNDVKEKRINFRFPDAKMQIVFPLVIDVPDIIIQIAVNNNGLYRTTTCLGPPIPASIEQRNAAVR